MRISEENSKLFAKKANKIQRSIKIEIKASIKVKEQFLLETSHCKPYDKLVNEMNFRGEQLSRQICYCFVFTCSELQERTERNDPYKITKPYTNQFLKFCCFLQILNILNILYRNV